MSEQYFLVELRCGTCGLIFAAGKGPLSQTQADELAGMFREKGPQKYQQCKNRCPRQAQGPAALIMPASGNYNQRVIKTWIPPDDEFWKTH
jgi:hypothetical protein